MSVQEQIVLADEALDSLSDLSIMFYRQQTLEKFAAMEREGFTYDPTTRQFVNQSPGFAFGQPLTETAFGAFLDVGGVSKGKLSLLAVRGILSAVAHFVVTRDRMLIADHLGVQPSEIDAVVQESNPEIDG